MNKILNREKFSYDLNGDALYQQYKDKYMQQGKMAMQDTMGQAAAMTGGYGNSYAATAGNQAYQAHLENLNDIVPELYQMAYDKYNQEGQDLYNQFGLLSSDRSQKYGEWEAGYNRALAERDYTQGVYESERSYDYGKYIDGRDFAYGQYRDDVADQQWQQSYDYQVERDAVADQQWQQTYDYQVGRDAVTDAQWQASFNEGQRQFNADLAERQRQFNEKNSYDSGGVDEEDGGFVESKETYAGWDRAAWDEYFSTIRTTEGEDAARAEAQRLLSLGYLPQQFAYVAGIASRGTLGH
jgi:hypothetical protein